MTQRDLINEFYAALFDFRKAYESDVAAAGALGIDNNVFWRAWNAEKFARDHKRPVHFPKLNLKNLRACAKNGDANLSLAAEKLLSFIEAVRQGRPPGEFSYLYAGMQLLMAEYDLLLRACVDDLKRDDLDQLAATGLILAFIDGNYHWACARYATHSLLAGEHLQALMPAPLKDVAAITAYANELLRLASKDECGVFECLNEFVWTSVPAAEAGEGEAILAEHEIAELIPTVYAKLYTAGRVAETFKTDAYQSNHLRRQPLHKLAVEVSKLVSQTEPNLWAASNQALAALIQHDMAVAKEADRFMAMVARCATGNRPLSWLGEKVIVSLARNGVTLRHRSSAKERAFPKRFTPLPNIDPDGAGPCVVVIDTAAYDALPVKERLPWPDDKVALIVEHKLNSWKRGDPHQTRSKSKHTPP